LWETEVLRSSRKAEPDARPTKSVLDRDDEWLTVREASAVTGISATTIKRLARSNEIPSHLEKTDNGFLRIVSLVGVRRWNRDDLEADPDDQGAKSVVEDTELDLTREEDSPAQREIPEGTMLVPLDAWNKMLNQLGNLHEAGQQLAEARERAAKAETEARFLKERLREIREELEKRERPEPAPDPQDRVWAPASHQSTRSVIRKIYSDWRRNRPR